MLELEGSLEDGTLRGVESIIIIENGRRTREFCSYPPPRLRPPQELSGLCFGAGGEISRTHAMQLRAL